MRSLAPSLLPPEIDLTYNSGTRSARFGPPAMLPGPAVNSMVGRSEEENGRAVVAAASPTEVTRNPEVVDFENLLGDLSAAFVRVSVEEIDDEMERWLHRIVVAMDVDRGNVAFEFKRHPPAPRFTGSGCFAAMASLASVSRPVGN